MAGDTPEQDRTEAATPRRLQRAREEGRVPLSREVQLFTGLAAATLVLAWDTGSTSEALSRRLATLLAHAGSPALTASAALRIAADAALRGGAPCLLAVMLAGLAASLLQTGFLIHGGALRPELRRISPRAGLRRLLGTDNLIEALKAILKLAVIGVVVWRIIIGNLPALLLAPRWAPATLAANITAPVLHLMLAVLAIQGAVAAFDLLLVRLRHLRQMRMTREEVRDEQRETEGDPKIKARIRQIRQQRARKRMMAAVPKATVVITNPTHYAVALAYDRARNAAPRVVAKGVDELAARIRDVAAAHRVPLVANPPLARALYRVEVDTEIPAEHYQAVAEIIAYVWRLGQRSRAAAGQAA